MPTYAVRSKRDTRTNLTSANRTYGDGQIVVEKAPDNFSRMKVGDGSTAYNSLPYIINESKNCVSVKQFGAIGDGVTDDTVAVQAAINAARDTYGIVFLPLGVYRVTTTLNITDRVLMCGVGVSPYRLQQAGTRGNGSWLFFDHVSIGIRVHDSINSVTLGWATISGVQLRDFGTIRNQPVPGPGWQPNDHDFDISIRTSDVYIQNIMLWNATRGVKVEQPENGYGRITIDNLRGSVFKIGIELRSTFDMPRISNVHFWPFWWDSTHVHAYTLLNLYALVVYRADGLQLHNFFVIKAFAGLAFGNSSPYGGLHGTHLRGQYSNVYIDLSFVGILVELNVLDLFSFQAENVVLTCEESIAGSIAMRIRASNTQIDISNLECAFCPRAAIAIEGTGNQVSIGRLRVNRWNARNENIAAVVIDAGNTLALGREPIFTDGSGAPEFSVAVGGRLANPR